MRVKALFKIKLLALFFALALGTGCTWAQSTLNSIKLEKTDGNGYKIILNTNEISDVKKVVKSADNISIELKNTESAQSVATIYNDVADVESILIGKINKQDLKINLQCPNIAQSEVLFDITKLPASKNTNNGLNTSNISTPVNSTNTDTRLELNAPMESYAPIYEQESEEITSEQNSNIMSAQNVTKALSSVGINKTTADKIVKKLPVLKRKLKSLMTKFNFNSQHLGYLGVFLILAVLAKKMFGFGKSSDNQIKIGLTQSLKQREVDMYKDLSRQTLNTKTLETSSRPAPSINYGIKQYQNSQKNPYTSAVPHASTVPYPSAAPVQMSNQRPMNVTAQKSTTAASAPVKRPVPQNTAPKRPIQRPAAPVKKPATPVQQEVANIDSLKFLESMTKIYEKNGRQDLAKGLQENMKKAKMTSEAGVK